MSRTSGSFALVSLLAVLTAASPAVGATLTPHPTVESFLASVDPAAVLTEEFLDGFAAGTVLTDQIPGLVLSSPNQGMPGFVPVQVETLPGASTPPHVLAGGFVDTRSVAQTVVMDFPSGALALSFVAIAQSPTLREIRVEFQLSDGTVQTLLLEDVDGSSGPSEFFGVTADVPFDRVTITSNEVAGGLFQEFGGLDDLRFAIVDALAPLCLGAPREIDGVLGIDGSGTDDRPGDTGIAAVALEAGATNLALSVDPFAPGDGSVSFRVEAGDPGLEAQGTVVVTDGAGNTCTLCLNFRNVPPGPTFEEVLCCADGIAFFVSNDNQTDPGPAVCSSDPLGDGQPPLPPGYEPSEAEDPWPCTVFTIQSPIEGSTEMVLKKDGDFDPMLRLLFSRSEDGGLTFPPFEDVTDSVKEIADVIPDPTRIKGRKDWSPVKVACAVQAELCNGLDDDGDGLIDEGLPVGDFSVDQDADGFFLCAADPAVSDCNDQIDTINPAASEVCNFLDDDCDGVIDEDDPGGGLSCAVDGGVGACAAGETACTEGLIECRQTVDPSAELCDTVDNDCDGSTDEDFADLGDGCSAGVGACAAAGTRVCAADGSGTVCDAVPGDPGDEVCDGIDNDCDGAADDGNPGGGADCGATGTGECQLGVTACVDGGVICVGDVGPVPEVCGDGLDNDCDGDVDEALEPDAVCSLSPSTLNVGSESTSFQVSVFSLVNRCDPANPAPLDLEAITTAWISRAGETALPDPFAQVCPDPVNGTLFEPGIVENRDDRQRTGNDLNLKFNRGADGDCGTLDGSRQDLFAVLADVVNETQVPVCIRSSVDGVDFECCTEAEVRNTGNR